MLYVWGFFWGDGPKHSQILKKVCQPKVSSKSTDSPQCCSGSIHTIPEHLPIITGSTIFCSICSTLFLWTRKCIALSYVAFINATKDLAASYSDCFAEPLPARASGVGLFPLPYHPTKVAVRASERLFAPFKVLSWSVFKNCKKWVKEYQRFNTPEWLSTTFSIQQE